MDTAVCCARSDGIVEFDDHAVTLPLAVAVETTREYRDDIYAVASGGNDGLDEIIGIIFDIVLGEIGLQVVGAGENHKNLSVEFSGISLNVFYSTAGETVVFSEQIGKTLLKIPSCNERVAQKIIVFRVVGTAMAGHK